jgi:hypothetical protein
MGGSEVTFHQWGVAAGAVLNYHSFGFFADQGDAVIGLVEIIRSRNLASRWTRGTAHRWAGDHCCRAGRG